MKQVKVLILDDSLFMRESLARELERDVNIKVVAKAASAVEARDKIVEYLPDILISDVNLGEMSGIEFIRILLPQYYLPVIMMSSDGTRGDLARAANAVAFVTKPRKGGQAVSDPFFRQMLAHVRLIACRDRAHYDIPLLSSTVVAIGASTGGAEAIETVLKAMPSMTAPIVIAQHMPERFTRGFAQRINTKSLLSVKEARDGDVLLPGQAYIAPGGKHMIIKKSGERMTVSILAHTGEVHHCPSIDMLFHSVADTAGDHAIGVLLTGMGRDGAQGLKHMHDAGAATIGQDEATSVVYGMPKAAFENGSVDCQVALDKVAYKIQTLLSSK